MRFSILICCLLLISSSSLRAMADHVVVVDGKGKSSQRSGRITDLRGAELTIEIGGREVRIPMKRVASYQATWSEPHVAAEEKFASGDFNAALQLYGQAFSSEERTWAKQHLLSRVMWCYRNTGQHAKACRMFAGSLRDDPQADFFAAIPLQWRLQRCPGDVSAVVQGWMDPGNRSDKRLMAASWLLVDQRNAAIATLRELGKDASSRIASLAVAQLWRAEMLTLQESRIAWWSEHLQSMPFELRGGAYYLLGQSHARFGQTDDAALAFVRVPTTYPHDLELGQRAYIEAAALLGKTQKPEAIRLYQKCVAMGEQTELGKIARTRLAESGVR